MQPASITLDTHQIARRIDAIIRELEALRQQVSAPALSASKPSKPSSMTEELFGSAGQGDWDEYDPYLDIARFADEYIE